MLSKINKNLPPHSLCFVDYDSMLYDLQVAAIKLAKDIYNVELKHEEINDWNFFKNNYPKALPAYLEWEHYKKGIHIDGSVDFVNSLYDIFGKENVFILTNSHPSLIENKDKEIEKIYGTNNIIHAADKYLITGDNFLLDDHCDNIVNHVEYNKNGIGILFDYKGTYGWNKEKIECNYDRVYRNHLYSEILETIKKIKKD